MNRNQKIALGCGGAGCLGLIVLVVAVIALSAAGYLALPGTSNYNYNSNRNSNYNSNLNRNYNSNTNTNSSDDVSSSLSDDDKHKLFQAAGMTKDNALILRVLRKLGFASGTGPEYEQFVKDHFRWAMNNLTFIQSVNTPETARAYVEEHLDD